MEVIIRENPVECAQVAALIVAKYIREKGSPVFGLATGSTPESLYVELISMHRKNEVSFRNCTTFNLDEYVGLPPTHEQSYHYYMRKKLFDQIDIPKGRTHLPDGMQSDLRKECNDYENQIAEAGGIDLQILGIGNNGHIGFNEPMGSLSSRTWVKILSRNTIKENSRYFDSIDEVPKHAITMGISTILDADHCLILAYGERKSKAVFDMIEGPVTAKCPASILQLHKRTTVVLDATAAEKLQHRSDYAWVEQNKLSWQRYD